MVTPFSFSLRFLKGGEEGSGNTWGPLCDVNNRGLNTRESLHVTGRVDTSVQYKRHSYLGEDKLKHQTTRLKEVSPHKVFCLVGFFKLTKES